MTSMQELWVNKNKRRYYRLIICKDLFGDTILMKEWGSIDSNGGRLVSQPIDPDNQEAILDDIRKRRISHQYQLNEKKSPN